VLRTGNSNFQIPNHKQILNSKFQILNTFWLLEFWSLDIVCNLVLGAWSFHCGAVVGVVRKCRRELTEAHNVLYAWSVSEGEHLDKG